MKKLNRYVIDSLKHWFRMRRWMRTYEGEFRRGLIPIGWRGYEQYNAMFLAIGEYPSSDFCSLCTEYWDYRDRCGQCPLGNCSYDSPWYNTVLENTKADWLNNSKEMIRALWAVRYAPELGV